MNQTTLCSRLRGLLLLALCAAAHPVPGLAAPSVLEPGVSITATYMHTTADAIVSYDWSSTNELYYMTFGGYPDVNVWKANGATPLNIYSNPNNFAGASVVALGNYIYFNDSDLTNQQFIRRYGPENGSASTVVTSSSSNNSLYGFGGRLFISGSNSHRTNSLYATSLEANGAFTSDPPPTIGETGGASGALTFDLAGNLYYAPGFVDLSIYRFTATEVAAALAQTTTLNVTGHRWLDYGSIYDVDGGATSMLIAPSGDLLLTVTNFSSPSFLARFGVAADGTYGDSSDQLLSDSDRLGELRLHAGEVSISSGNSIYTVVPEPSSPALLLVTAAGIFLLHRRRPATPICVARAQ